jgi:ribosomal small subunit protein bTHX
MGRGDKKTKKGKIFRNSFGNRRRHNHHRMKTAAPRSPHQGSSGTGQQVGSQTLRK